MADRPPPSTKTPDREARGPFFERAFALETQVERGNEYLCLRALHRPQYGAIHADWLTADVSRRIGAGRKQALGKAIGLHKPRMPEDGLLHVLDATAGLGRDAYLMAALGARVTLVERNPTVCALLRDALARVLATSATQAIGERIAIIEADACAFMALAENRAAFDVVHLDPMYPDDGKAALPSKEMQILRDLTGGDADADELLAPALLAARHRVVVKRPSKAPPLAGVEPSLRFEGTQLRFDVYLRN
ncbi:class I SAM-dependent methyltransferase [Nevskia ramosa]|uniref:class I SAM-dependent methyltransferase n=1 Tax=Nevskia ramosa TaxID=64002 RepID=UPI0023568CF1|nr:class I SAM-dependent methyltransferase [Nevskia ramosa]